MENTEKMTNNAGDESSTLLVPKAKISGKRCIIQQFVAFYIPISFIHFISTEI